MAHDREIAILSLLLTICLALFFIKEEAQSYIYVEQSNYENSLNGINNLLLINNAIKLQLLDDQSYTRIASQAASEGFVPAIFITP